MARVAATYVVAVRQTLDERADRVPTAVPHRGYKPRGVMRDVPAPPARPELSAAVAAAPPIEYRTDVSGPGRDRAPMRQVDLKTADRLANEGLLNRSTARVERHLVGRAGTVAGRHAVYGAGRLLVGRAGTVAGRHAVYGAGRLLKSGGLAVAAPPVMAGVLAARAGRAGYQTTAGLREIARGTRNVARWGYQSIQRGMERVAAAKRAVVDTIKGAGRSVADTTHDAFDSSRNAISNAPGRAANLATRAAARNPLAVRSFNKGLEKAMEKGPDATRVFLEKVAASPTKTAIARRAGLDSFTVVAAIGPAAAGRALSDVYVHQPKDDRETTALERRGNTLQKDEYRRNLDFYRSGGAITDSSKLEKDPVHADRAAKLVAESLGFDPPSDKDREAVRASIDKRTAIEELWCGRVTAPSAPAAPPKSADRILGLQPAVADPAPSLGDRDTSPGAHQQVGAGVEGRGSGTRRARRRRP